MRRIILYHFISFVALGLFLSCSKENDISNTNDGLIDNTCFMIGNVINTDIFPTENTWFEIKIDLGPNPDFWMGCWDYNTEPLNRIVSRFFIYENNLCYDFPDDRGGGWSYYLYFRFI